MCIFAPLRVYPCTSFVHIFAPPVSLSLHLFGTYPCTSSVFIRAPLQCLSFAPLFYIPAPLAHASAPLANIVSTLRCTSLQLYSSRKDDVIVAKNSILCVVVGHCSDDSMTSGGEPFVTVEIELK